MGNSSSGQGGNGGNGGIGASRQPSRGTGFQRIADNFKNLDEVQAALRREGLESSNLIVGVDVTKSNTWTGKESFGGRCLHAIGATPNPYEEAISIIGRTLSALDDDGFVPSYMFGDASTGDQAVFSFLPDDRPCAGFEGALSRYREIISSVQLAGPTSFAPIIRQALRIVNASGGAYHILLIVADGQVTRSGDMLPGQHSLQERETIDAILLASHFALSIVVVGVGDGPWDVMRQFDDELPARQFDNLQFVEFNALTRGAAARSTPAASAALEARFATAALMEVPEQYAAITRLGLLGRTIAGAALGPGPLPPPPAVMRLDGLATGSGAAGPPRRASSALPADSAGVGASLPRRASSAVEERVAELEESLTCLVCAERPKNTALGCGHQLCAQCASMVTACPQCRTPIALRVRLYG